MHPWRGRCAHEGEDVPWRKMCPWRGRCGREDLAFCRAEFEFWKGFPHAFWKMMFLVEAANTVKRYSAFPKTITSNPKSHFVFGVLPIAQCETFYWMFNVDPTKWQDTLQTPFHFKSKVLAGIFIFRGVSLPPQYQPPKGGVFRIHEAYTPEN